MMRFEMEVDRLIKLLQSISFQANMLRMPYVLKNTYILGQQM